MTNYFLVKTWYVNYSRDVLSENTYVVEMANVSYQKKKEKIKNTCWTSLDKIKLVEKVAESHLKFETGYAAQLLSSFHGSFWQNCSFKNHISFFLKSFSLNKWYKSQIMITTGLLSESVFKSRLCENSLADFCTFKLLKAGPSAISRMREIDF